MHLETSAIQGFDVHYQLWRLRNARAMSDAEAELIWRSICLGVRTYEQIVEASSDTPYHKSLFLSLTLAAFHQLLAWLPPHAGGLLPIGFGLFHQQESIREITVDFLNTLRTHPVSYLDTVPPWSLTKLLYQVGAQFIASLNYFHRVAYTRLLQARETAAGYGFPEQYSSSQSSLPQMSPSYLAPSNVPRMSSNLSMGGV